MRCKSSIGGGKNMRYPRPFHASDDTKGCWASFQRFSTADGRIRRFSEQRRRRPVAANHSARELARMPRILSRIPRAILRILSIGAKKNRGARDANRRVFFSSAVGNARSKGISPRMPGMPGMLGRGSVGTFRGSHYMRGSFFISPTLFNDSILRADFCIISRLALEPIPGNDARDSSGDAGERWAQHVRLHFHRFRSNGCHCKLDTPTIATVDCKFAHNHFKFDHVFTEFRISRPGCPFSRSCCSFHGLAAFQAAIFALHLLCLTFCPVRVIYFYSTDLQFQSASA